MVELTVTVWTIVTWRLNETIPVGFGTIHRVLVWRFLLEMERRTEHSGSSYFTFKPLPETGLLSVAHSR